MRRFHASGRCTGSVDEHATLQNARGRAFCSLYGWHGTLSRDSKRVPRKTGGDGLTQMQLQKLVFFAHGWTLAETGYALTEDDPEAWVYGPVYRDLYDHTKYFGSGPIGRKITPDDDEAARFFFTNHQDEKLTRLILTTRSRL
ncbi:Panacea domain-containing protein [Sphingomonas aurantiaca]|uniref:Panacea domain-containing protein n=1 Tax=Sphingomonas aurantiaca TaxID=185949 RepID=UPI003A5C613C